jgi:clan AA aspartic protease
MIEGYVRRHADEEPFSFEIVVPVTLRGFGEQEVLVEAVLDTGYTGPLSLREEDITALGLVPSGGAWIALADGSEWEAVLYTVIVAWDGIERLVQTTGDGPEPLIGIGLLNGHNLSVDVTDGGAARITRLP